ncbi:hypothetical protein Pmar_PMAR005894 [Perkinsus marinus ATCC 50983]|uniref:Uncharacterized protein n=1 Tax=Perkinsus marinus (strain ATCC 50983 / TXsc) TaxID=423536 RepID=C5LKY9_PERM5|nr:hypothetical protein Pmar_PMAR005894 [Perkinsus marinus ATCC 50983]EER02553.1 hypothetical protein Pmar_PMAR005894 [Perkinsus marinus ATCC 50983]|eukprot:XP_002769835.1 hypothetical protein Pmar_PMAR005894 [Perkinsus marinus ATCC 50983]
MASYLLLCSFVAYINLAAMYCLFLHDFRIKTSATGYPAYTGAQHQFVSKEIPVPQKEAVYASLWENVDMYADPSLIDKTAATIIGVGAKGESRPFDWIQHISLQFICETRGGGGGSGVTSEEPLAESLTHLDILEALSKQHELDLLPSQLDILPHAAASGIHYSGLHEVHVRSRAALEAARKRASDARKAKLAQLAKFDFKEEKSIATDLSGAWAEDEDKDEDDKAYLMNPRRAEYKAWLKRKAEESTKGSDVLRDE